MQGREVVGCSRFLLHRDATSGKSAHLDILGSFHTESCIKTGVSGWPLIVSGEIETQPSLLSRFVVRWPLIVSGEIETRKVAKEVVKCQLPLIVSGEIETKKGLNHWR